jgi:16S rRNA (guanine(1405)-N(7))-methyltransferase
MNVTPSLIRDITEQILDSRKYRESGLNPVTIEDLIIQEAPGHTSRKHLLKSVRRKLHNIVAPYLGEPDYSAMTQRLEAIVNTHLDSAELGRFCLDILSEHASTAERLSELPELYTRLFHSIAKPEVILDLACGLHPLGFPWMGLPLTTSYHAYDIIQPRIDFINHFFTRVGLAPLAENQDIIAHPPEIKADVAFFFKEAHRIDKRQSGANREFWSRLQVDLLIVSLPAENLSGTHSLADQHRQLVMSNLPEGVCIREQIIGNEIFFMIDHPGDLPW